MNKIAFLVISMSIFCSCSKKKTIEGLDRLECSNLTKGLIVHAKEQKSDFFCNGLDWYEVD